MFSHTLYTTAGVVGHHYAYTRMPAWCDRVLISHTAQQLLQKVCSCKFVWSVFFYYLAVDGQVACIAVLQSTQCWHEEGWGFDPRCGRTRFFTSACPAVEGRGARGPWLFRTHAIILILQHFLKLGLRDQTSQFSPFLSSLQFFFVLRFSSMSYYKNRFIIIHQIYENGGLNSLDFTYSDQINRIKHAIYPRHYPKFVFQTKQLGARYDMMGLATPMGDHKVSTSIINWPHY